MLDFPLWKRVWLWAVTLVFALAAEPSLVTLTGVNWPAVLPSPMVNLGLDLAGGSHIMLEADPRQVEQQRLDTMEEAVRAALRDAEPRIRVDDVSASRGRLSFVVEDPSQVDAARDAVEPLTSGAGLTGQRDWTIQVLDGNRFVVAQTQAGLNLAVDQAMDSATEVVRKRIDALGTREPTINEPIIGGSANISGNFTVESANQLAIALRSGALPVDLTVIEEFSISAELGADSIQKGTIAMLVGLGALLLFMLVTYGRFGFSTCAALILNVLMILGVMALLGPMAALTLPGIAGLVLTVGAAVDANVLINERIREERARGRRVVQAVEAGYKESSSAIFDANITNVIAAVIMFVFGTGPIRGFAVVLIIGIVTSVFTAVTLTRMWVAGWLRRKRPTDIVL